MGITDTFYCQAKASSTSLVAPSRYTHFLIGQLIYLLRSMVTLIQPYIWFMYKFIIVVQFNDYLFISYPGGTTTCCGSSLAFSKYYAYTFYRRCSHGCKLLGCNGQFTNATAWIFSATFKYAGVLELIKEILHWTFWTAEGYTKCKRWSSNWRWYWERVRPPRRQVCSLRKLRKFGPIALKPT